MKTNSRSYWTGFLLTMLVVFFVIGLAACTSDGGDVTGAWKSLGQVDGASSIWRRQDPDTGDTIYATSRGGIFVVKAEKK